MTARRKLIASGRLVVAIMLGEGSAQAAPAYDRWFDQAGNLYAMNADLCALSPA